MRYRRNPRACRPPYKGRFPNGKAYKPDAEAAEYFAAMSALGFSHILSEEDTGTGEAQRPVPRLSDEVLAHLQGSTWPGNVRELAHWMERMVILCEGERLELAEVLAAEDMGQALSSSASAVAPEAEGQEHAAGQDEQQRIIAALQRKNWMVSGDRGAARLLGMSHQTLRYRMRKYGIQRPKPA